MKYRCGEEITTDRIEDEPWYSDYQEVSEVMCAGPSHQKFFERMPDGFEQAKAACYARFMEYPGPPGWSPPDVKRLESWIKSMWMTEEDMTKIDQLYDEERSNKEPKMSDELIPVMNGRPKEISQPITGTLLPRISGAITDRGGHLVRHTKSEGTRSISLPSGTFQVDAQMLMRMIKQITQTIGEHQRADHAFAAYVVPALRKARGDIVSDLERHFGIHWKIDDYSGKSVFYT